MGDHEELPHRTRHWKAWVFEFFLIFFSVRLSYLVDNDRQHLTPAEPTVGDQTPVP